MTFIPKEQYEQILQLIPICCVDLAIVHDDKLLIVQRGESETWGCLWWIVGGRVHIGESWHDAVKRKARDEVGLDAEAVRMVQSYEAPEAEGKHFVTTLFVVSVSSDEVTLDDTSTDYRWVSEIDTDWHSLLKKMVVDAEIFNV
jgi:ADP-ribose pyrophosphatase YjhB (NUDIX family)